MKQKFIVLLLILLCCGLVASPNRKGSPCPYSIKKEVTVIETVNKPAKIAEDLEYLPMHQMVNSLL